MARSERVSFQGKCTWNSLFTPNQFGKWEINFYPNEESKQRLKALNLKNKWHQDDDGEWLRISCPHIKQVRGKDVGMSPPIVTDSNNVIQTNLGIGHGSDVTVTVVKYSYRGPFDSKTAPPNDAIRLEGVRVDHLIPYDKESLASDPKLYYAADTLAKQPPQPTQGWN